MTRRWRAALGLALLLAACAVEPVGDVPRPPGGPIPQASQQPRPEPLPTGRTARPISLAGPRAAEAQEVAPQPILAGVPSPTAPPAAAAPPPSPPGDITLDFNEADIRAVVAAVLGDILKRNYVVDQDVQGTVSLSTSQPLTREALLPTLQAVLESRGATMVETDGLIRVTPLRAEGGRTRAVPRLGRAGAGQRIQAIPTRFIAPSELQRVIEPVLSGGRVVMVDDQRRLMIVQGNAEEIQAAQETARIFDVDQLAGTQVAMVLLQNADAATLVPEVLNLFGAARKAGDPGVIRFIPIERLNAVIILARQARYMEEARSWIARLDRARRGNEPQLYVYHVQHGKAAEVARTLRGVFGRGEPAESARAGAAQTADYGSVPLPGAAQMGAVQQNAVIAGPGGVPTLQGQPAPLAPGEDSSARPGAPAPAEAEPQAKEATGPRIRADDTNNSLLIMATPREFAQVQQVLEQIDIPPLQVLIEATIAEVTLQNELRYGVQYFLQSGQVGAVLTQSPTIINGITPPLPGFAFSASGGLTSPRVLIDALSQLTQTNVVSTPRLLVLDNQLARLQVGDVVPIVTSTSTSTLTATPVTINSVQYRDTGVVLEVTPRVNASGFVSLDISQSVSDVVRTTTSNIDSPTIRQRRIRSSIGVQSGQTILLGGLIRDNGTNNNSGIPILHELPIVGALFGNRDYVNGRTELIVLLTPRVIRNQEEARDMTSEISRKFQAVLLSEDQGMTLPRPVR